MRENDPAVEHVAPTDPSLHDLRPCVSVRIRHLSFGAAAAALPDAVQVAQQDERCASKKEDPLNTAQHRHDGGGSAIDSTGFYDADGAD